MFAYLTEQKDHEGERKISLAGTPSKFRIGFDYIAGPFVLRILNLRRRKKEVPYSRLKMGEIFFQTRSPCRVSLFTRQEKYVPSEWTRHTLSRACTTLYSYSYLFSGFNKNYDPLCKLQSKQNSRICMRCIWLKVLRERKVDYTRTLFCLREHGRFLGGNHSIVQNKFDYFLSQVNL